MRVAIEPDPARFADRVMPFLEAEVERNLPATILLGILEGRHDHDPVLAYGLDEKGAVIAVAVRTPPFPMICTTLATEAVGPLLDVWLEADPGLTGLNAPAQTAQALARAWEQRSGGVARRQTAMALHSLTRVLDPPRPAAGELRLAREDELPLLIDWTVRFSAEAHARVGDPERALRSRLAIECLWLWHAPDRRPVSMVAANPPVAGIPRIGPVYTPPGERRHGFAGSAVAAASRILLARGARACTLFTDLANPTSNRIYAEVGYRPIGAWEEYALDAR